MLIWLGRSAGIIMAIAYIPQMMKIIKNKSSRDVSLPMYLIVLTSLIIYEAYAISVRETVFMWTNTLALTQVLIMLGLIWRHR